MCDKFVGSLHFEAIISPLPQGERVRNERLKMLKTEFNWDRIAEKTFEVYKRVLAIPAVSTR